jgi:hypothetical protein
VVRLNADHDQNYIISELSKIISHISCKEYMKSYRLIWGLMSNKNRFSLKNNWSDVPWLNWTNEISGYVIRYCKKSQLVTSLVDSNGLYLGMVFAKGEFIWTPSLRELHVYARCVKNRMDQICHDLCPGCVNKDMDKASHLIAPAGCEINYFNTSYAARAFQEITCTDYLEEYFIRMHHTPII